ncbi:MAG: NADH-quinone oxidoreductase subunit NuoH [Candidatus Kapabacteria bacterium]|nr:NADH-quinone oxidoreductase subunit NuoH [Candidatus Kapabacteria bacterium]MDW8012722.1 NADH-quinone oxidoreductase subunit NuoH [Bacteroidota bacterium]
MTELLVQLVVAGIKAFIVINTVLLAAAGLVYAERRIAAWIQDRIGPNRVGPFGLLQPFADVIKLYFKEDLVPALADRAYHRLAPWISITVALSLYAVIPIADSVVIGGQRIPLAIAPNINVGVLYILAMASIGVYGIVLAGWASNNKYSLLGGLRSSAQMISYELALGLSIVGVVMVAGTLDLAEIIARQQHVWNIVYQPLGFLLFLIASFAETNRAPFDLPEAEPELVGGYHTEYSGMKFGLFFLAEYSNMVVASLMMVVLFLGGWHVPFIPELPRWLGLQEGSIGLALFQAGVTLAKTAVLLFLFIWVRWTVPRFRYDQLMRLGWRVLLPLALLNIVLTGAVLLALEYVVR